MAIEIKTDDLDSYKLSILIDTGDGQITAEQFLSRVLSDVESRLETEDPVTIHMFSRSKRTCPSGLPRCDVALYPWMLNLDVRVKRKIGILIINNRAGIRKVLLEHGIHMDILPSDDYHDTTGYIFSKTPFDKIVTPDGHVGRGRPKSEKTRKQALRDIVIKKLAKSAVSEDASGSAVDHPDHYNAGKVECIDAIESATAHLAGPLGFSVRNNIKYNCPLGLKHPTREGVIEDLEKSLWYTKRAIEYVKSGGPIFSSDEQDPNWVQNMLGGKDG